MRLFFLLAILSTAICVSTLTSAGMWYVDGSVPSSGDGRFWGTALKTIQEGIDKALAGDTVTVARGAYVENIDFKGKNIVLTSIDPLDPTVVASTVIDGNQAGSVVTFSGAETGACVLTGFTIQNGRVAAGGGIRGGLWNFHTHATIRNNVISGNVSDSGAGGVAYCDGLIENNTITGNSAVFDGGGLNACAGTIRNNTITRNVSGRAGGGVAYSHGLIENNMITGNSALSGGGVSHCQGTIQGNAIAGNSAEYGGGVNSCGGTFQNNTITRNSAPRGSGLGACTGPIRNCILWANTAPAGPQLEDSSVPTYSCIEGWSEGGEGNIASEPQFFDLNAGDYRLQGGSPCIDAGYNDPSLPTRDITGMHRIMNGGKSQTVDMGAWEYYVNAVSRADGGDFAVTWSLPEGKTYSIFYTDEVFNWHLATDSFSSSGDTTTVWVDDGSLTGIASSLAPCRFYRLLENP
jgi:hypothetical protein